MTTKDDRYRAFLDAFTRAVMGSLPAPAKNITVAPVVLAACHALAVRTAKDGKEPLAYSDFIVALKDLDVID